jgi:hypothetical protein
LHGAYALRPAISEEALFRPVQREAAPVAYARCR